MICGGGSFPAAVAEAVVRQGRVPIMFGVNGWADPGIIEKYTHHWIFIGQLGRFFRLARSENCRDVLLIGSLLRPPIKQLRLDWQTIKLMPRLVRAYSGGDDQLLGGLVRMAEDAGFRIVGLDEVAPEVFVSDGVLGHYKPSLKLIGRILCAGLRRSVHLGHSISVKPPLLPTIRFLPLKRRRAPIICIARITEMRRQGRVASPLRVLAC